MRAPSRVRPNEREHLSRDAVLLILIAFVTLLGIGALAYLGVLGVGVQDVQQLLGVLNLALLTPTPATDAVHFALGFTIALGAYVAVTSVRGSSHRQRIHLEGADSPRRNAAIVSLAIILAVASVLILGKEFFWDPVFEGASIFSGFVDYLTYTLGIIAGVAAGLVTE